MVATPSDFRVDPERTALTLPLTQNDSTTEGGLPDRGKHSRDPRQYYRIANVD